MKNFIPKSRIKEKIEELEDIKLCGNNIHFAVTESKINLLKELLNEE